MLDHRSTEQFGGTPFHIDVALKASTPDGELSVDSAQWIVEGLASTSKKDTDDETVIQKGLDIDYFRERGFFNYNHSATLVGFPYKEFTLIKSDGMFTRGELFKDVPMARTIWTQQVAFQAAGVPRTYGFSIEGRVQKRDDKSIVKAKVINVAISPHQKNSGATLTALYKALESSDWDLLKTLDAGYKDGVGSPVIHESLDNSIHNVLDVSGKLVTDIAKDLTVRKDSMCTMLNAAGYDPKAANVLAFALTLDEWLGTEIIGNN